MENKDLNEKVLNRLREKIAIEEYRVAQKEFSNVDRKIKPASFFKVASVAIITTVVAGNLYTYATYNKDIFSYVLDRIGIFEIDKEKIVQVNDTQSSNDAELTLENYGIDEETLIIGYRLKSDKPIDSVMEYFGDTTTIIDENNEYHLEANNFAAFYPISDTEYEVLKSYSLDPSIISDNAVVKTNLKLYKYLDTDETSGEWEFEFQLEKDKTDVDYEEYLLEDKYVELEILNNEERDFLPTAKILEIKKSDMATKLVIYIENYLTDVSYFVEVLDENGNTILEDNIQRVYGGIPTEVLLRKIDFNSKINVNIYEKDGIGDAKFETLSKGNISIDLVNDLKKSETKEISYITKEWCDLNLTYDDEYEVDEYTNELRNGDTEYTLGFALYEYVGNEKFTIDIGNINLKCFNNTLNKNVQECFEEIKSLNVLGDNLPLFQDEYTIYLDGSGEEVKLNHAQMIELSKNREIVIDGTVINSENNLFMDIKCKNMQKLEIDGAEAISWIEYDYKKYVFEYNGKIYIISTPNDINDKKGIEKFINSIKFTN